MEVYEKDCIILNNQEFNQILNCGFSEEIHENELSLYFRGNRKLYLKFELLNNGDYILKDLQNVGFAKLASSLYPLVSSNQGLFFSVIRYLSRTKEEYNFIDSLNDKGILNILSSVGVDSIRRSFEPIYISPGEFVDTIEQLREKGLAFGFLEIYSKVSKSYGGGYSETIFLSGEPLISFSRGLSEEMLSQLKTPEETEGYRNKYPENIPPITDIRIEGSFNFEQLATKLSPIYQINKEFYIRILNKLDYEQNITEEKISTWLENFNSEYLEQIEMESYWRTMFIEPPEDNMINVRQGEINISSGEPIGTFGLSACSAVFITDGTNIALAHIDIYNDNVALELKENLENIRKKQSGNIEIFYLPGAKDVSDICDRIAWFEKNFANIPDVKVRQISPKNNIRPEGIFIPVYSIGALIFQGKIKFFDLAGILLKEDTQEFFRASKVNIIGTDSNPV